LQSSFVRRLEFPQNQRMSSSSSENSIRTDSWILSTNELMPPFRQQVSSLTQEASTFIHSPKPSRVEELFGFGGWFDRTFGKQPGERLLTWSAALSIFVQRNGSLIVETGCQRQIEDLGDGSSTRIIAMLLHKLDNGILHSVDISAENLNSAKTVIYQLQAKEALRFHLVDRVRFHLSDSVEFLRKFDSSIDFLYLDSCDYFEDEP